MDSEFVVSANRVSQFPTDGWPEVAFLGRSNVGKSSLINTLTGKKGLAFTSSTPGRTQTINFYRLQNHAASPKGGMYFVDLPGYGYAKVPVEFKREWKLLIDSYLSSRTNLELSVIILDARRGWMDTDLELKAWLEHQGRRFQVVATKMDKLKQSEVERGLKAIRKEGMEPLPFSAVTGRGVREIWQAITKTLQQ